MKQELYNRRWNLLFFGENEEHNENCKEKVKKIVSEKLQIRNVDSMKFCGVHRVGQKRLLMLSSCKKPTVVPRAKIFGKTTGEVKLYIRMALAIREVSQFFLKAT